jgi:2-dehydro-3-deoxy-D-arabinonate dehydratase
MKLIKSADGWWGELAGRFVRLGGFDLDRWLAGEDPVGDVTRMVKGTLGGRPEGPKGSLCPIGSQEVWAAGVTYLRSKAARMEESDFSATAYDRVYEAPRPEIFFKATARRCSGDGQPLNLRTDSKWMVPEPELALVISSRGKVVGFTLGNDLSCRDIEGENLLYLPQAKVWDKCCGLGPCILVNDGEADILKSTIKVTIERGLDIVFEGETPLSRIKRSFDELSSWLFRDQTFPQGVIMLTGTGIVPADDFTLAKGDRVAISAPEIGRLENPMA